jgi:hypothetical protein
LLQRNGREQARFRRQPATQQNAEVNMANQDDFYIRAAAQ